MSKGMRPNRATAGLGVIASIVAITCVGVASAQSGAGGGDDSASAAKRAHRYHGPRIKTANSSRCDWFDPSVCLQPWPNDRFTTKAATATGKRLNLNAKSMPKNKSGVGIDPVDYNRNDGFSPGQPIVVHIPGMDSQKAFNKSGIVPVDNIRKYADPAQPVVVIDAATGARNPIFAEMDAHALKNSDRQLIIHPSNNFDEGHRYIVALRNLKNAKGKKIQPSNAFKVYRDRLRTRQRPVEKRRKHMEALFRTLRKAGIARKKLDPRLGLHRGERGQPCGARAGGEERRLRRPRRHEPRQRHGGGQLALDERPLRGDQLRAVQRQPAGLRAAARTTRSSARSMATWSSPAT